LAITIDIYAVYDCIFDDIPAKKLCVLMSQCNAKPQNKVRIARVIYMENGLQERHFTASQNAAKEPLSKS
jgi:hypothetical protein